MTFSLSILIPPSLTDSGNIRLRTHKQTFPTSPFWRSCCLQSKREQPNWPTPTIEPHPANSRKSVPGANHRLLQSRWDLQRHPHACPDNTRNLFQPSLLIPLLNFTRSQRPLYCHQRHHRSLHPLANYHITSFNWSYASFYYHVTHYCH